MLWHAYFHTHKEIVSIFGECDRGESDIAELHCVNEILVFVQKIKIKWTNDKS